MADDFSLLRTTGINERRVVRGGINRRAACLLIVAIGIPTPQSVTLPTLEYTQTLVAPAVQVSGNQSVDLPTLAYAHALSAPAVSNTSDPPQIIGRTQATRVDARRVQRGGVSKAGINTIVLQPAEGNFIALPTLSYALTLVAPYVISNPGMLYLGGDDGKWPKTPPYVKRVSKAALILIESGAQNIPLPTLSYSYTLLAPAVQVSGAQSVTLPTLAYVYDLVAPQVPQAVLLPTLAYSYTLVAPVVASDPVVGPCRVRAYRRGYFAGRQREVNDEFSITTPYEFSPYWMDFVDAIPATWTPFIRGYVQSIDDGVQRAVDSREAAQWAATDEEPSGRPDD